jgi:hypothetical protein
MAVESSCTPDGVSDLFIIYFATVDFVRVTFSYFNKQLLAGKKNGYRHLRTAHTLFITQNNENGNLIAK